MKDFHFWKHLKKKSKHIFSEEQTLIVLASVLAIVAISLIGLDAFIDSDISHMKVLPRIFTTFQQSSYPLMQDAFLPAISAQGAIVVDATSRVVLFSKDPDVRFSPASTTKITTALTALDYYHTGDVLTVKRNYVEGSGLHFFKGEKLTFLSLLYAMMLPSANDAAYAVADNYPGGSSAFIAKMNDKVHMLSLANTHFSDPAGLNDDMDYTTARDLATIATYAINHPLLSTVVGTKEKVITSLDGTKYDLGNLNKLLGYYGVDGIKTGTTDLAGEVLVTSVQRGGHTVIIVVMRSSDRFADTQKLLTLITNNLSYLSIHP